MGEAARKRRRNAPPSPAEGERVIQFRVVRLADLADIERRIGGDDADARVQDARRLCTALLRALQTLRAPFSDPALCGCCGTPVARTVSPMAWIIGFDTKAENDGRSWYWRAVCADCSSLPRDDILAGFERQMAAECPSAHRVSKPD